MKESFARPVKARPVKNENPGIDPILLPQIKQIFKDGKQQDAYFDAIAQHSHDLLAALLSYGIDTRQGRNHPKYNPDSSRPCDGICTGLYHAALNGNDQAVKQIIAVRDEKADTRLVKVLISENRLSILNIFLQKGQVASISDALNEAVRLNKIDFASAILPHNANANGILRLPEFPDKRNDLLFTAVENKNAPLASLLLQYKANPNSINFQGITSLMKAAKNGDRDCVRLLLSHGADINARPEGKAYHKSYNSEQDNSALYDNDIIGKTAIEIAQQFGHREIIALLAPSPSAPPASRQNSEAQLVTHAYTPATGSMREKPTQRSGFANNFINSFKM